MTLKMKTKQSIFLPFLLFNWRKFHLLCRKEITFKTNSWIEIQGLFEMTNGTKALSPRERSPFLSSYYLFWEHNGFCTYIYEQYGSKVHLHPNIIFIPMSESQRNWLSLQLLYLSKKSSFEERANKTFLN